jgi:hypothetical protein
VAFISIKEIADTIWILYGISHFWGKDMKENRKGKCQKDFWMPLFIIDFLLIMGLIKLVLYVVIVFILIWVGI